jgi:outer membrane protein assembly factor BamD
LRWELDQTPTYRTIDAISEYILDFPDNQNMARCREMLEELNERLDKKAYEAAKLYYKMEDYLAARIAFRNVLKDDSDNMFREDILYHIAMSSYKYASLSYEHLQKDRYLTFVDDYLNFIGEIPESRYRRELDAVYRRAQKALGKDAVQTEESLMSDREFEKARKRLAKESK